ncbi:hypothetical protein EFV37_20830 [Mesorhizobium loti]|uniref:Uncharacterized protein n=1 Tax=Mesorhizobium jarvisii TaxID=1777867 RepID=A0A6M7TI44_9HYPH|nr:hypothetical protein EB229_20825 [Mesorhizobium jarvisii]QKD10373.1 hypothetical protein EFV37_20830 [Mesorhizobium loti]RJT37013.1 hypothetical protein D3242_06790 [Mesorhizobium jarvisii]
MEPIFVGLTADIVSAHVSMNAVPVSGLSELIGSVHPSPLPAPSRLRKRPPARCHQRQ